MNALRRTLCVLPAVFTLLAGSLLSAAAQHKPVSGLFWKASSSTNTIYLLGSFHLGTKEMYPLPDYMEKAFQRSSVLVVELDLNKVNKAEQEKIGQFVTANGTYTGEDTLWKHIGAMTKEKVQAFCSANGLPPDVFAKTKPWLVALSVSLLPLQKAGMQTGLGIDKYFLDKAKDTKRVEPLETMEQQMHLLSDIPPRVEEKYLLNALEQASRYKGFGTTMQNAWINGEADKLDDFLTRWSSEPAEVAKKIREDRNPHMAEVAESYLKKKEPCFIVVGAAHLVGKEGVIRLLQKKGYKVEQVTAATGAQK